MKSKKLSQSRVKPLVKGRVLPLEKRKKLRAFRPMIRSRHPSHDPLRDELPLLPFRSVVRLGSGWRSVIDRIECNTREAVLCSANKRLMKTAFGEAITSAQWANFDRVESLGFPIVAKHIHGSRGTGNYLIKSQQELNTWRNGKTIENYIFEKFHDYSREYRLHVTADGCFYTCRKMLREGTPEAERWYRNDSNCVWVLESNPQFDKPVNWDAIVRESVNALRRVGLDIGAIDVKVQSATDSKGRKRQTPAFIVLETNSAPSFGEVTLEKYIAEIPKVLRRKYVG